MKHRDYYLLKSLAHWQPMVLSVPDGLEKPNSIPTLSAVLDQMNDQHTTVSFDVFDTLLRRNIEPADHVHRLVMERFRLILCQHNINVDLYELLAWRKDATHIARQHALNKGFDSECSLSEIYRELFFIINRQYQVDIDNYVNTDEIIRFELSAEIACLELMPDALSVLQEIRGKVKKLFAVSDMYLESWQVEKILDHFQLLDLFDQVYVSSSYHFSKGSGRLFKKIIKDHRLDVSCWLHVGDNEHSDIVSPRSLKIGALQFYSPEEIKRRSLISQSMRACEQYGDASHLWSLQKKSLPQDPAAAIGYQRFGPIMTLFALDIFLQSLEYGYDTIHFLARDGYLIKQLYSLFEKGLDAAKGLSIPQVRYLYLSRASTRFARIADDHNQIISLALRVNQKKGVYSLIPVLGLSVERYEPLFTQILSTLPSNESEFSIAEKMRYVLENDIFQTPFQKDLAANKVLLKSYLEQQDWLNGKKNITVDIGWNGSILQDLEFAFGDHKEFPDVTCRFFGRLNGCQFQKVNIADGFAFDESIASPIDNLFNQSRELFELVASSSEGSVLSYEMVNSIVKPCLADVCLDGDSELHNKNIISRVQSGVLLYCQDFIEFYNRFMPSRDALLVDAQWQVAKIIAGHYPNEISMLGDLSFDLSWGASNKVKLKEYLGLSVESDKSDINNATFNIGQLDSFPSSSNSVQKWFESIHFLVERLRQEKQFVFYGVGTVAQLLAPLLIDYIDYFVDGNHALCEKPFLDKPVRHADQLFAESETTVFVSIVGRKQVIANKLSGYKGDILYIDDFLVSI